MGSISGEFTTIVDLYHNLRGFGVNVELGIFVDNKKLTHNCIRHLIQNNNRDLLKNITIENIFESDLIICTSSLVFNKSIIISSENLFILDTLDLVKNDYILPEICCKSVTLFSNPANITDKIPFNQIEYYHKFSKERLDNPPVYYKTVLNGIKYEKFILDCYVYNRVLKKEANIKPGEFFENIGKRIFEHLYYDKYVVYECDGAVKPDGLYYYLKLFDIDGFIKHSPLLIPKQMVIQKLFMNGDDKLLNEICSL